METAQTTVPVKEANGYKGTRRSFPDTPAFITGRRATAALQLLSPSRIGARQKAPGAPTPISLTTHERSHCWDYAEI